MAKKKSPSKSAKGKKPQLAQLPATAGPGLPAAQLAATAVDDAAERFDARARAAGATKEKKEKPERAPDKGAELSAKEKREHARKQQEEEARKRLEKNGGVPKLYYEKWTKKFWMQKPGGFSHYSDEIIKLYMLKHGVSEYSQRDGIFDIDRVFLEATEEREIDYAGSLPGYRIGLHRVGDKKFLVTEEAKGVWDNLPQDIQEPRFFVLFFQTLLSTHQQATHFFNSLAVTLRALRRNNGVTEHHDFKPAPFTFWIGLPNCGKSLAQLFYTIILGGRADNPAKAMMEGEKFTAPLLKAEHWCFGDPPGSTDMKSRLLFADKIKEFCHEEEFVFRGMNKEGFKVPCFRRVSGSFNDQEEDLLKLPPMRAGLQDKINIYRCSDAREAMKEFIGQETLPKLGVESVDGVDRSAVRQRIEREAPMIRAWLLSQFPTVPEALKQTPYASRYGMDPFWHPDLIRELGEHSPQARFLAYVDEVLFQLTDDEAPSSDWKHGAVREIFLDVLAKDLEMRLARSQFKDQLKDQLRSTGRILGRLAESHKDRVTKLPLRNGIQYWRITNPFHPENKSNGIV